MAFPKGVSGNPSGRPKKLLPDGRSIRDIARDYSDKAIIALADVIDDVGAPAAAKVSAANALLDRGWGRPSQSVELSGPEGSEIPVSVSIEWVRPNADAGEG